MSVRMGANNMVYLTPYPVGYGVEIVDPVQVIHPPQYISRPNPGMCGSCAWFVPNPDDATKAHLSWEHMELRGLCLQLFPLLQRTRSVCWCPFFDKYPESYLGEELHDPLMKYEESVLQKHLIEWDDV